MLTHDEWTKKAIELFGETGREWRFVCPICKTIQKGQDFIDAGCSKEDAAKLVGSSCIGRQLPKIKCQKAFGEKKLIKGMPCDYAGYGFFQLNPVQVQFEDGEIVTVFAFDEPENK